MLTSSPEARLSTDPLEARRRSLAEKCTAFSGRLVSRERDGVDLARNSPQESRRPDADPDAELGGSRVQLINSQLFQLDEAVGKSQLLIRDIQANLRHQRTTLLDAVSPRRPRVALPDLFASEES